MDMLLTNKAALVSNDSEILQFLYTEAALRAKAAFPATRYSGASMLRTQHSGKFYKQWETMLSFGTSL
jgi:hypothetical protein